MAGRRERLTFFEEQLLFELRAIRFAVNDHSKNTGKWLAAIALAAANPTDNTAEVQARVDELASQLNLTAEQEQEALDKFSKSKER